MPRRFAPIATVLALSLASCAPAEPPLLIDDTSSATVAGDEATPVEIAEGSPPRKSDEYKAIPR